MPGEGYRTLLDCRRRSRALRARSFTFDQIAYILALDHDVSPLRLYRYAHGRTAGDIVAAHNDLDPAGTASLREARLYDYEAWPATGRRIPARTVVILSRIYQTTARSLLTDEIYARYNAAHRDLLDQADYRHLDPHQQLSPPPPTPSDAILPKGRTPAPANRHEGLATWTLALAPDARDNIERHLSWAQPPTPAHCTELLCALRAEETDVKRRELLFELALLFGGTPGRSGSPSARRAATRVTPSR
ncbi:hypothetical protein AB0F88_01780 [Streptosporangium sp. NPDC023963]|uniref:hypothetical protein n=1 Tax=Streptosporangium sp. NPDC023963 TaxID=3155608 RepID=UPI00344890A5